MNPNNVLNQDNQSNPSNLHSHNDNSMNHSQNTNSMNHSMNSQTIVQNNNIHINPFGQEDISFITKEMKKNILSKMYLALPELVRTIHNKDFNRNVLYKNVKKKVMGYLDSNNNLRLDTYDNIIEKVIEKNIDRLDSIYQEVGEEVEGVNKERLKIMIEKSNDRELNGKYKKDLNFYFEENSIKNRKLLKQVIEY